MGIFSRKKKKFAGLSNSRMMKDNEYPRALKDSTAAYISDLPNMTNRFASTIADYNNAAIEQSIVFNTRKAINYTTKPEFTDVSNPTSYSIREIDRDLLIQAIRNEMIEEFGQDLEINYMILDWLDYAHLAKYFLSKDYNYEPINNTITIDGKDYWIEDGILHLNYRQDNSPVGYSFSARKVPGREEDLSRPYTQWDYREDKYIEKTIEDGTIKIYTREYYDFKEGITLDLIELYKHEYLEEQTIITNKGYSYVDENGDEVTVEETIEEGDPVVTDIINTKPSTNISLFDSLLLDESIEVIEDTETQKIEKVSKLYAKTYYPSNLNKETKFIDFSEYYNNIPNELAPMNELDDEDKQQALEDYKNKVENGLLEDDIFSSEYIISIEFTYINSEGNKVIEYRTLVDNSDEAFQETYYKIILDNLEIDEFGNIFPNLYLRIENDDIAEEYKSSGEYSDIYKVYKKYAKKLGVDYDNILKDIKESQKEEEDDEPALGSSKTDKNWGKIRTIYLTAGIPAYTEDVLEIKYLYEFFNLYSQGEIGNHNITYRDLNDYGKTEYTWELAEEFVENGQIYPDKDYKKHNIYKVIYSTEEIDEDVESDNVFKKILNRKRIITLYKQISPTQYKVLKIADYNRQVYVHKGIWAGSISGNADDAEILVPLDNEIVHTYFGAYNDKEAIISKSLRLEFLTYVEKKESFLGSTLGKIVSAVVGAVITVINPGAGAGWFAGATALTIIAQVAINLAVSLVIDITMQLIVKTFGGKFAKYLAIVIAVAAVTYGGSNAISANGFATNSNLLSSLRMVFNKTTITMLNKANKLFNTAMQQIGVEFQEEMETKKQKLEELQTYAESMLAYRIDDSGDYLSQINRNYISPNIGLGLTADEIMQEATDYNKMITSIDYIHDYADFILRLPTLNETVRFMYNNK